MNLEKAKTSRSTRLESAFKDFARPVRNLMSPRRIHGYGLGAPKSGTHSLAAIFADHYRARHEAELGPIIGHTIAAANGVIDNKELTKFVRKRDRRFWLEFEASHPLHHIAPILVKQFPESKFILTIRDPYSWLHSFFNQTQGRLKRNLSGEACFPVTRIIDHALIQDYENGIVERKYRKEELILAEHGLYPLGNYLSYWYRHNQFIINTIPQSRLLIIRTDEISSGLSRIAEFMDVPSETLSGERAHSYAREEKTCKAIYEIDRDFLEADVNRRCGVLMKRYFPDIKHLEDVLPGVHTSKARQQYGRA